MNRTIDERVVEMRFDNKHFEENVSTTMSTLDKLKQKLHLTGATKGLEDINAAAKKVDMSPIGSAVESVGLKFNAMYSIADQALRNITNKVQFYAERIVSSLTIDPVKTGLSEYETKINSIQTIMSNTASKGTTMEDVTRVIGELNTYADKTIYNFAEMTRNIGTFTAAGIGLEESAAAIQGIANLAAASGSNSQQASTAMYQLSQALSTGTVRLMDWNSVVNAGMGGEKFQEALKATAREHGVAVDDIISKNGSFRDSLQDGWLSADILNQTLRKFTVEGAKEYAKSMVDSGKYTQEQADALIKEAQAMEDAATKVKTFTQLMDTLKESAQSGWGQTWEILIGDFEEAKELFTAVSDVLGGFINKSADARNELLKDWDALGGRADLINALKNTFESIVSVVAPIKDAFREIFPRSTAGDLFNLTKAFKDFTAKLTLSEVASENLKRTFKGLFAVIDIVRQVIVGLFKGAAVLLGGIDKLGGGVLSVTAIIGDWLVALNDSIKSADTFGKFFTGVASAIRTIGRAIKELALLPVLTLISSFLSEFDEGFTGIGNSANTMKDTVSDAFSTLGSTLAKNPIFQLIQGIWKVTKFVITAISTLVGKIAGGLAKRLNDLNFEGILEFINTLSLGAIALGITKLVKGLSGVFDTASSIKDSVVGVIDSFSDVIGSVGDTLKAFQMKVRADAIMKIAIALTLLAASLIALAFIPEDKLEKALGALTTLAIELMAGMAIIGKFNSIGSATKPLQMIGFAIALSILATSCKKFADMEWSELAKAGAAITGLALAMSLAFKLMSSTNTSTKAGKLMGKNGIFGSFSEKTQVAATSLQMIAFAAAIKILASAVKDFAYMEWGELAKAGVALAGLTAAMVVMANAMTSSKGKKLNTTSLQMVTFAAAIKILGLAIKDFAYMEWSELAKAGVALAGLTAAIVVLSLALNLVPKSAVLSAVGLVAASAALIVLAGALKILGTLSLSEIGRGLLAMGGALAILALGLTAMIAALPGAASLIVASVGLVALTGAMKIMGTLSWSEIGKGLATMAGALVILAVGLTAMLLARPGATSLIVASVGLIALAAAMKAMSTLSWSEIGRGLITIAGALVILAVGLKLIQSAMLGAVALFVAASAFAILSASVVVLAAGITMLAAALSIGAAAIVAGLTTIVVGIASLIPLVARKIAEGIIAFCDVIAKGAPVIGNAIKSVVLTLVDVIVSCSGTIASGLFKLFISVLKTISSNLPTLVGLLFDIIIGLINGVAERMPDLIRALVNVFVSIFEGAADALSKVDTSSIFKGILGVGLMAGLMVALASIVGLIPGAMLGLLGIAAVVTEMAIIIAAFGALAQIPGLEWLITEGGDFLQAVGTAIGQFVGGIAGGLAKGISSSLPKIGSDLSKFMSNVKPFIDGVKLVDASVVDGIKHLAGAILAITATSVLNGMTSWLTGGSSILKFATQLPILGLGLKSFSDITKGISISNLEATIKAASALVKMTSIIPNEGGMVAWFTGDNSVAKFASQLPILGLGLLGFSTSVAGINTDNVKRATEAASELAKMASIIPNEGGIKAWFTGDNSIAKFASQLPILGLGLLGFSTSVAGINAENIKSAASSASELAKMTEVIPNSGGIKAWFTGDNSIAKFASQLPILGLGLLGFSASVVGINSENIKAASISATELAKMTEVIPNSGGIKAWFTGDNSIAKFAGQLPILGLGLRGFSVSIAGINAENIKAAASAAKDLATMASIIPNEGGIKAWFTGDNSISKFAGQLPILGLGLLGFSASVAGINAENIKAATISAAELAKMTSIIPTTGGIKAWFTGDNSIAKFASQLPILGLGLVGLSSAAYGISSENITKVVESAKAIANLTSVIPNSGGIKAWFTGDNSITRFALQLPILGAGLLGLSVSVMGINANNIKAAASAATEVAKMTSIIPTTGGIKAWFTGDNSMSKFASQLPTLGLGLKAFSASVVGVNIESIKTATSALKSLASFGNSELPSASKWSKFASGLNTLGYHLKSYFTIVGGISSDVIERSKKAIESAKAAASVNFSNMSSTSKAIADVAKSMKDLAKVPKDSAANFKKALKDLGETSADSMVKAFRDAKSSMLKAGKEFLQTFIDGVKSKSSGATTACTDVAKACSKAMKNSSGTFESAGKSVVQGFVAGIKANRGSAISAAQSLANSIQKIVKQALKINSPSKVFAEIGSSVPEGFALGISKMGSAVKRSTTTMTDSAISGVQNSISRIADAINGDIDAQPTIRPVLDLSDVRSGAGVISGILGYGPSIGVAANLSAISGVMNRRNQNKDNSDIVSEIKKLRNDIGNIEQASYSIGNISVDSQSEAAEILRTLIRVAEIERRA